LLQEEQGGRHGCAQLGTVVVYVSIACLVHLLHVQILFNLSVVMLAQISFIVSVILLL
jgi:hypothetical protein